MPLDDDEPTGAILPMVSDDFNKANRYEPAPANPSSNSHRMSKESAEMFKKLHGRYPDGYVPPSATIAQSKWFERDDDDLEQLAAKANPKTNDWNIPVAYDFNKNFVPSESKFGATGAKPKTNQWAEVGAMSF